MDFVYIFFLLSTFTLLRLAWQDYQDKLISKDLSMYMMGATGVIFLAMDLILIWIGFLLLTIVGITLLKRVKSLTNHLRAGDITVLSWILPSLLVLNWVYFATWVFFWCVGNVFMCFGLKKKQFAGIVPMFFAMICLVVLVALNLV